MSQRKITIIVGVLVVAGIFWIVFRSNDGKIDSIVDPVGGEILDEIEEIVPDITPEVVPEVIPEDVKIKETTDNTESFNEVFAYNRAIYGKGYVFQWNGNAYTTDYKTEL